MKQLSLLTIILFFFFLPELHAQTKTDERNFSAIQTYYESGQYKTGLKRLREMKRYYTKKKGQSSYYVAAFQAYEAMIYAELGKFEKYETALSSARSAYAASAKDNLFYQLKANRLIAEAYAVVGKFNQADSLLTSLTPPDNYRLRDEILQARYLHYLYLYKKTYLNKVSDSLNLLISAAKQRIVLKDSVLDRKGNVSFAKLSKFELFNRKELYAKAILLQVEVVYSKGRTDSASVMLDQYAEWIRKNIGYKGGVLAKTYLLYGMMAAENDELKEAARWLGKASGVATKYYKANSPVYAEIQKQIITNLLRQSKFEEASIRNNDLDVKILSYYGRSSLPYLNNNLIDVDREIANRNWKRAARHLEDYLSKESLPAIHLSRLQALQTIYAVYLNQNDWEKAEKALSDAKSVSMNLYGKDAPAHHLLLLRQAEFFTEYTDHYKEAEEIYNYSFDQVIRRELPHGNRNYYKNSYGEARLYEVLEKYAKAYALFEELLKETEKNSGKNSVPYAIVLEKYANLDITTGKYQEAENKISTSLKNFENYSQSKYNTDKLHALETNLRLKIVEGKFEEASSSLAAIKKLIRSTSESEEQLYASVEEISLLNIYLGKFQQTEDNLNEIIDRREKRFGEKHHTLINPLLYKGYLKLVTGNYNEAEENIQRAENISKELFGSNSLKYAACLVYHKRLYFAVGDYEKAEKAIRQVVEIQTKQFGPDNISVGKYLHELALAQYYYLAFKAQTSKSESRTAAISGDGTTRGIESKREKPKKQTTQPTNTTTAPVEKKPETIDEMFSRSYRIIQKELGANNPEYALALENGALYEMYSGNYEKAYQNIDQAKKIWKDLLGEENVNSARVYFIGGTLQHLKGNYNEALQQFVSSRDMYRSIFDDNHPGYIEAQGKCAQMYYIMGDVKKSVSSSEETIEKSLLYLDKIFPGLSERGKANYWEKVKNDYEFYKTLAFTQYKDYPQMVGTVYNITLRTKAILLNSSVKVKQKIQSSGDTTLIGNYERWQSLKEDMGAAVSMSASQRKEAEIDIAKMETEIEELEKKLSLSSELFAKNYEKKNHYDWEELKKTVGKNEVVLEVVPFRYFDKKFTDTVWYAMMAVSETTKNIPDFVVIKNGHELQKKYMKYYRNCIKFQLPDEESYKAYWEQLTPLIKNENTTVYLSADGVYNQLNLETLRTPDGNFLINKNKIILIGSSRDLIDRNRNQASAKKEKNNAKTTTAKVTLLGNPDYYKQGYTGQKSVPQLPGAQVEIKKINDILAGSKYKTEVFVYDEATEESVKEQSGPKVFHIATHGFFLEDAEEGELDEVAEKAVQNPLLRSGLLLKNGGEILQNENVYAFNKEDGILTAYEAMNLNFDNTELVVLSACETGLGEVKLGEGVLGLQRSFLVAGSQTIIMSLFKVSDEVTTELMASFYQKWLSGQTKRNAFVEAKKEIMAKYNNPQYWGAFIMIGLE
ncbi:MAG TPA: CHAT domain-containing tetratricopeptide repeat protein [Cytophagaceae bacterium]|nr:CHAT domain-containing tetratricopeptide repeat protein [Cytophagaceae bacterium]